MVFIQSEKFITSTGHPVSIQISLLFTADLYFNIQAYVLHKT